MVGCSVAFGQLPRGPAMLSRGATPRTPTGPAEGLSGSLGTFTGLAIGALWLDARWPSVSFPEGPRCCPGGRPPGPPRVRLRACPGRWGPSPASPLGLYGWMLGGLRSASPRARDVVPGGDPPDPHGSG